MATKNYCLFISLVIYMFIHHSLSSNEWNIGEFDREDELNPYVLQAALRNAHAQRLSDLEALEKDVASQIRSMQARKYHITAQKRQHIACLVHVLSCYKKRR